MHALMLWMTWEMIKRQQFHKTWWRSITSEFTKENDTSTSLWHWLRRQGFSPPVKWNRLTNTDLNCRRTTSRSVLSVEKPAVIEEILSMQLASEISKRASPQYNSMRDCLLIQRCWIVSHLDRPLVAGCSIGHKPRPLYVNRLDMSCVFDSCVCCDWFRWVYGQEPNTTAPTAISAAQTLAPNGVKSTRWQCSYLEYFGFTFMQWEEVKTYHPYFIQSMVHIKNRWARKVVRL